MRDIFTVAKFTMHDMVTRKSYVISTIIILILIVLGFNLPNIIQSLNDNSTNNSNNTILIVDESNLFNHQLDNFNPVIQANESYQIKSTTNYPQDLETQISHKDLLAAIIVQPTSTGIEFTGLVRNLATSQLPTGLTDQLTDFYQDLQIQKLHLTPQQLKTITPTSELTLKQTDTTEINGNILAMMFISIVLFYAIYFCAFQVSSSITTEKTSKIIETLVTSTTPSSIVLGKTIGIGLVGLGQIFLIITTAIVSAKLFLSSTVLNSLIDQSALTLGLACISILYFLLGYFIYACIYALTGSTVSKPEDVQSANMPVSILACFSFYLAYFTLSDPTSSLNTFAALFPFSSPFCMPLRFMMGLASIGEIILSIAILIITSLIISRVAIKIYSNAILNNGNKMTFRNLIKAYKSK